MEKSITYDSGGTEMAATYYWPDHAGGSYPAVVLGHGFAGALYPKMARYLAAQGYGVLSLEFRGYHRSGGQKGHFVAMEQVSDYRNALTFLESQAGVDRNRLGLIGSSLGGATGIMASAIDDRVKVCVAGCPVANGDTTLRPIYDTAEKMAEFIEAVKQRKVDGKTVHRFEIVPIPPALRDNLPPGTPMDFTPETVLDGFLALNPKEVIASIAPRPVFVIHAKDDRVVRYEEGVELAELAGDNAKLLLVDTGDHFIFNDDPIVEAIAAFLKETLPLGNGASA